MNKEQKNITYLYIALFVSLGMNFIPYIIIQQFGFLLFITLFIATYIYKHQSDPDSLTKNHMIFIIRTIWIGSLILTVGIIAAGLLADNTIIHNTVDGVMNGVYFSETELNDILIEYTRQNLLVFAATILPSIGYLIYRFIKGAILANKNQLIPNLKHWL